ncbi:gp03 R [Burkholderia phage BcepB1A]|uniref:gp03 R n=1 Tax=Burkholderia phage BcepB1A TaxID=279530 RepID=UPI00003779BA|nr:gp03 R [Burkholderia phage BcepB1A]AAT37767.1 gp03 R [Burkholderia phage BcepB1A]
MTTLSKRVLALVAAGASALTIATQFLHEKEGDRLIAYQDTGGKWTACMGVTRGVKPHARYTQAECDRMDAQAVAGAETDVESLVTVPMSKPQRAAVISFCGYNLGATKCSKSTFLRLLNEGKRKEACEEIKKWTYVGGKDCTDASNNCRGIPLRRDQEYQLCLMD